MRILTVFAGITYVITGALCYFFISFSFSSLAFPAGMLMLIAGLLISGAYIASGKRYRLTDTVLVEGLVDIMFGFAVLNNQVSDAMLSMFFGSFTCIAGATRLSQALDVSRYKPRDWAKVMPLSIVTAVLGILMMMPKLIPSTSTMMIVGAAFIINGFSILVYSMYMEKRTATQKEEEARARTLAKKAAQDAKREQRDRLRKLSKEERDKEVAAIKQEQKQAKQARKEARRLEIELARASRRALPEDTKSFSKDEAEEVKRIADRLGLNDESVIQAAVEKVSAEKQAEENAAIPAENESAGPEALAEQNKWPSWQKPTDIPSLRSSAIQINEEETAEEAPLPKLAAVNLEALEGKEIDVKFDSPELRDVELISESADEVDRRKILDDLEKPVSKDSVFANYVPLTLEDLIDEELPKPNLSSPDDKRFTERMSFTWGMTTVKPEELEEKEKEQEL